MITNSRTLHYMSPYGLQQREKIRLKLNKIWVTGALLSPYLFEIYDIDEAGATNKNTN